MRSIVAVLAFAGLAACAPPQAANGPEAVVQGIYAEVAQNIGHAITPIDAIPMTDDLKALVDRAEAAADARDEPFLEGDLAATCRDCDTLTELEIGDQAGPEPIPEADGHTIVEARFKLNGSEDRAVLYDLVETPDGWRVDNVLAEGLNLRTEAEAYLADRAAPPTP